MKGICYVVDSNKRVKAVQIKLSLIEKYDRNIEDLLDIILVGARQDEKMISFDKVAGKKRKSLRK